MEIPLQTKGTDIYSFGFDSNLNRNIPDNSTGVVYDSVNQTNTGSVVAGGNLTLKTLSIGGLVRQVAPGDDIQAAIDAVNREGGGTVQLLAKTYDVKRDLTLRSNVVLTGAGKVVTTLQFTTTSAIRNESGASNFVIANLKTTGGKSNALLLSSCSNFLVASVRTESATGDGIRLEDCDEFKVDECESTGSTGNGFSVVSNSGESSRFGIQSCSSTSNTGAGFLLSVPTTGAINRFRLDSCVAESNTGRGFYLDSPFVNGGVILSCEASNNGSYGFDIFPSRIVFIGCSSTGNTGTGIYDSGGNTFIDCYADYLKRVVSTDISTVIDSANAGTYTGMEPYSGNLLIAGNIEDSRKTVSLNNGSGATAPLGAVVVLSPGLAFSSFNTTSTNGDNKVFGMLLKATPNNNANPILTEGRVDSLLVSNGTASIAVGDWLSTYSHAYYAKKAVAGDMVFAFALEAPTTSTASINALLVSPRLI